MSVSTLAPRRVHPSLVRLAQTQARVRTLISQPALDGDQILGDFGQILTAPPEVESAPETPTTPAPEGACDRALIDQIDAIDADYFLQLNIDADQMEREHLRAQIARWEAEEEDARHCGLGGDWSAEIEAAADRINVLNARLEAADLRAEMELL